MDVVEIDFTDRELIDRYDRLFEECPDAFIQQSTHWAEVIKDLGPDRPVFLLCHHGGQDIAGLPLYLYENDLGNILTSVPQPGPLGGIFFKEGLPAGVIDDVYRSLLDRALNLAERFNCITLTIITTPFCNDLDRYERYLSPDFVFENFTQYISLCQPVHRSHGHRNNLNRAKKAGYSVQVCQSLSQLCAWYKIHRERHRELGAPPLEYRLFENIFRVLVPRNKAQLVLVLSQGEIASGGLYIYHKRAMDVFMLSTASKHLNDGANFINTDYSTSWAEELGVQLYNWQSSPSRESGVYHYKRQWGSVEAPFYFVTRLLCEPRRMQKMGLGTLKAQYPWHYVVPYAAFEEGLNKKYFRKG